MACDNDARRVPAGGATLQAVGLLSIGAGVFLLLVVTMSSLSGQSRPPEPSAGASPLAGVSQSALMSPPGAAQAPTPTPKMRALLDQVLRHLPQRPAEDREPVAPGTRPDEGLRPRRALGESDPQAARWRDATARPAASTACGVRGAARLARGRDRSDGRTHAGLGGPASVEPHRYANAIRDLLDLRIDVTTLLPPDDSANGLRQHRRVADDLADAARVVHDGRGACRAHGSRLLEVTGRGHLPRVERRLAEPPPRWHALRHARRHRRTPRLPGRWRVQVLNPELRHRQLHPERAARARHRWRARTRLAVSRRRAWPSA